MGRAKKYTPEKLEQAVKKYFLSITRQVKQTEMIPTGEKDARGREICEPKPIVNCLGDEVVTTEYILPPSVSDLCEALQIHRSTWANYCDHRLHPEFTEITEQVHERLKAWNERELLTRPGKDLKGIIFNLENVYGYRERSSVDLAGGAVEAYLQKLQDSGEGEQQF